MKDPQIIQLRRGDYTAKIRLDRGANCISLRNQKYGAVLLREPPQSGELDNPYLYGMPVLFPVNRISGGRFSFESRHYLFPINEPATGCHLHGTLHETPFTLLEQEENRVLCAYRADEEHPYLQFPHSFEIHMEYALENDGLRHSTRIRNLSDTNMPVMLGFHTTFNARFCPDGGDPCVLVQIAREYARNMKNYLPTGETPEFDAVSTALNQGSFDPFSAPTSRHYRSGGEGEMVIYDPKKDLSLIYENDRKLGFRLIYNGNADGYICLEPQNCLANAANSPFDREEAGFDWIAPGQEKTYVSRIRIGEGDLR